jgi:hypothetical protein
MWSLRRTDNINCIDRVRNENVFHRVNGRNILNKLTRRANWNSHILRINFLLKRVIEGTIKGRIEMRGRRGRRCKQLLRLYCTCETREYWKLKRESTASHSVENSLRKSLWTCRKTYYRMNDYTNPCYQFNPRCTCINCFIAKRR